VDRTVLPSVEALLITGTVGAGKTSVAEALGDLLAGAKMPYAVLDLDWLRRSWPCPPDDPFNHGITLRNLQAVADNFVAAGVVRLVLAGVVESRAERDDYQAAVGVPLKVGRLRVELAVVQDRLARRHQDDVARRQWHLARSAELDLILEDARPEDFVIDATTGSAHQVAAAVQAAAGW
jgi:adenylylsulfate kinase